MRQRLWVLALIGLLTMTGCTAGGTASGTTPGAAPLRPGPDWPTYHGDGTRAGFVPGGPDPNAPAVAWQARLDGAVYASPLVVGGLVVAATEGGSLYGLDARTGAVRWRTHLADPVPGGALPCGNIDPLGITGTPAEDPATGQVFAVTARAGIEHVLFGVDLASGHIRSQRVVDAPGSEPATQLQRAALLLTGGRVYIAYGGNDGDCGRYLGRVVGAPTDGLGPLVGFAVPTPREGGIWAPSGPTALPGGDLLVATGNGDATGAVWDHSDSVLRLSPQLQLVDGFAPTQWAQENSVDADLGSTGPVLLPGGTRVVTAGKGGGIYLLDTAALGGVGGQRAQAAGCESYGGGAATPGPGGTAVAYLPCMTGLLQLTVGPGDRLAPGWQASDQITGSPVVVGTTVWSVQQDGTLYALDTADGHTRATVQVGEATRFATPAVSGNGLFVPTTAGVTAVSIAP
ncbi:PQQ-binding-like beta-propeller repeat protein [Pseudonocardia acidicola]|uniref:PQQ-binding-like beta-propeller repeat protein n=1 Tax=Pseudonocardia acidicola TaxID=2724939 RepID=A0ABX1S9Q0_9PSEU|nr:PQQ-binding-like beta-propeller repeat protein [Pseudonocardia acidicola]NMH98300.1 PQQ-binding-like beta-propeller repeat protein [Pseudonocardia acidicola]